MVGEGAETRRRFVSIVPLSGAQPGSYGLPAFLMPPEWATDDPRDSPAQPWAPLCRRILAAHHQDWAVGMPDHGVGDTAHQGPLDPTQTPAAQHHQAGLYLLSQIDDLSVRRSHPEVRLSNRPACRFHLLDLRVEHLPRYLLEIRLALRVLLRDPGRGAHIQVCYGRHVEVLPNVNHMQL